MDEFEKWFTAEYEGDTAVQAAPFSYSELKEAFTAALTIGRAQGRAEGMEEGAKALDSLATRFEQLAALSHHALQDNTYQRAQSEAEDCADAIRQAAAQPFVQDPPYLALLNKIAEAASDYKMALANEGFAAQYGGIESLKGELFALVTEWEGVEEEEQ